MLVAHDLAYRPDPDETAFRFEPRTAELPFELPGLLNSSLSVFGVDANGTHDVIPSIDDGKVTIQYHIHVVGIYIVTDRPSLRQHIDNRRGQLDRQEQAFSFDPAHNEDDFRKLRSHLKQRKTK